VEKEDNLSERKDISNWFDQKFRIDRRSKVIPAQKKIPKKIQQKNPTVPFQTETFEDYQPELPVANQQNISPDLRYDVENELEGQDCSESIIVSARNSNNTYYEELLEKIVFNPEELNILKKTITDLSVGIIKPQQLKKLILKNYIRIFEEVSEFIPFYFEQELKKRSIDPNLSEEIREKDKFLEELGERINNIYLKLKKQAKDYSDKEEQLEFSERYKPFLDKIDEIDKDAAFAYKEERFSDYIQLKYLSSEKLIELIYYRVFNIIISDKNEIKINNAVKEIENRLNLKFRILKELNKWRKTRNLIVHEHLKVEKEQAKEAKIFFNDLSNKLKTTFQSCQI